MLELPGLHVATNGDQDPHGGRRIGRGRELRSGLATREREPDAPNYTPRISALLDLRDGVQLVLSILKANPADPAATDRTTFRPAPPPPGLGLCLTTYAGNGDPLPSFAGEPLWMPLEGDPGAVLSRYWTRSMQTTGSPSP